MRSDREEIPAPFTKADADKAETLEAKTRAQRSQRSALTAGCQTYWPSPYEVCGAIRDKYNALGGPGSFLSFPSSAELTNPGNTGKRTQFLNGPIYWSAATGAHPVVNSFLNRWGVYQYETGVLKYPTTDEIVLPDGGRRQEFQGGVIYVAFQNAVGAAMPNGPIRDKYNTVGGLTPGGTLLGYPTQDQAGLPDGQGKMDRFQNGVIYWHPSTGAHPILYPILAIWELRGYEKSRYGYPVSDQRIENGRPVQTFQFDTMDVLDLTNASGDETPGIYFDLSPFKPVDEEKNEFLRVAGQVDYQNDLTGIFTWGLRFQPGMYQYGKFGKDTPVSCSGSRQKQYADDIAYSYHEPTYDPEGGYVDMFYDHHSHIDQSRSGTEYTVTINCEFAGSEINGGRTVEVIVVFRYIIRPLEAE